MVGQEGKREEVLKPLHCLPRNGEELAVLPGPLEPHGLHTVHPQQIAPLAGGAALSCDRLQQDLQTRRNGQWPEGLETIGCLPCFCPAPLALPPEWTQQQAWGPPYWPLGKSPPFWVVCITNSLFNNSSKTCEKLSWMW